MSPLGPQSERSLRGCDREAVFTAVPRALECKLDRGRQSGVLESPGRNATARPKRLRPTRCLQQLAEKSSWLELGLAAATLEGGSDRGELGVSQPIRCLPTEGAESYWQFPRSDLERTISGERTVARRGTRQ